MECTFERCPNYKVPEQLQALKPRMVFIQVPIFITIDVYASAIEAALGVEDRDGFQFTCP